jgi:hypothetical protein
MPLWPVQKNAESAVGGDRVKVKGSSIPHV